eukprot:5013819-Alexandrium_andersonii.AAC.1
MKPCRRGGAQDDGEVVLPGYLYIEAPRVTRPRPVRPRFIEYDCVVAAVGQAVRRVPCAWADQTRAPIDCGGE